MRKIIYIGGFELPDRNAAALRVRNNAAILRTLGFEPVLIGTSRSRPYDRQVYPADAGGSDVTAFEVGYPQGTGQWFDAIRADWPVRNLIEQGALDPADIAAIIAYNHPVLAQVRLAQLAHSWGAKAFADCTEWYGTRSWTSPANIVKNLDVAYRMHRVNRQMDGIITTSPFMTHYYSAQGLPIVEIPTLIEELGVLQPPRLASAGPLPLFAVASGFGVSGSAQDIHDRIDWMIELLDEAAPDVPPFVLSVAGVDRAAYLAVFPHHAPLLDRLGGRVDFLGRMPRLHLLEKLEQSAFALVLRHESRVTLAGFPSKYAEAITYGTPVIINRIASLASYHVEGSTGFMIDTDQREAAGAALRRVLNMDRLDIDAMKRYCRQSRIYNSSNFVEPVRDFLERAGTRFQA